MRPGQPRDQEHGVAQLVREAEVGGDRGDGAVHVDRQRLPEFGGARVEDVLDRPNQPDVLAFELELERHLKQP